MTERKDPICRASMEILGRVTEDGPGNVFSRAAQMKPCPIGVGGNCCRLCNMGPCRIGEGKGQSSTGVCGETTETIVARNFARMVAAGTAAHSDHAREVVQALLATARGQASGLTIRDVARLRSLALELGLNKDEKDPLKLAELVGQCLLAEFGRQDGEIRFAGRAPERRQALWRTLGVIPRGIDREVVELLHRTHMGVDQDAAHLTRQSTRTALADGWGGSMIASQVQDVLFGAPHPVRSKVNLGVLSEDRVNVVIHGHEPLMPEVLVALACDPAWNEKAKAAGAQGINVVGICCAANELLMRRGLPVAGSFLQQELAISTGAVEVMVVDVQCVMQGLAGVAACHHTTLVTTSEKAHIPGALHRPFTPENAVSRAEEIVALAIENFKRRGEVYIPPHTLDLVAGFTHESVRYTLGGTYRGSYRPLVDNIVNGRIKGICAVVGCTNPRLRAGEMHAQVVRELIANDVLVLSTGCAAINCAKEGLMVPEAASLAGPGLREVCEAVGIPPVLHFGSCVDNSRLLEAVCALVREGGLGDDLSELPVVGCAPEWVSEKAIAIGHYFVASGIPVGLGVSFPTLGSTGFTEHLGRGMEEELGAGWFYEPTAAGMAGRIIGIISQRRQRLGIEKGRERVLFDMEMRRKLDV